MAERALMDPAITGLLRQLADGDGSAGDRLAAAVIDKLEHIAHRELAERNRGGIDGLTLEPGMFVHDALLKLIDKPQQFANRRHFFAYATQMMVRSMVDYHRARQAQKRGGDLLRVSLSAVSEHSVEFEELPPILEELERLDDRKADVVRLRVFWGANNDEIAELLKLSASTVERDWRFSKRWLAARLRATDAGDATTEDLGTAQSPEDGVHD